jgi:hypothetical protein
VPKLDQTFMVHLRVVTSLIEGRPVSRAEIVALVERILRQHSLDNLKDLLYQYPSWRELPP